MEGAVENALLVNEEVEDEAFLIYCLRRREGWPHILLQKFGFPDDYEDRYNLSANNAEH